MRALIFSLAASVSALAMAACPDVPPVQLCGEIPSGGCPIGRGGSCDDRTCNGLYDCVEGAWTLVNACSNDGGPGDGGPGEGGPGKGDGGCTPSGIDLSGQLVACTPDLENPDCPAAAAACLEDACLTGCTDFFLCGDAGWTSVAYCDGEGHLVVQKP